MKNDSTKSSNESANTIIAAASTAGQSAGSVTSRTACHGVAPRSSAASSSSGPIDASRPRTTIVT